MKKIHLIFLLLSFSILPVFAGNIDNQKDIVKEAIVKLIEQNKMLNTRILLVQDKVNQLEAELQEYKKQEDTVNKTKNVSHNSVILVPKVNSIIRENPHAHSKYVATAKRGNHYKIFKVTCYKNIGFWGKTLVGWVYISNPNYSSLFSKNNKPLSLNYNKWCNNDNTVTPFK